MTVGDRLDAVLDGQGTPASLAACMRDAVRPAAGQPAVTAPAVLTGLATSRLASLIESGAADRTVAAELLCIDGLATAAFEIGAEGDLDALGKLAAETVKRIAALVPQPEGT